MAEQRRKFDADFRDGAVQIVLESGRAIAEVARDLGVHPGTLGNWVKQAREDRVPGALAEGEREELVRLRREVSELRMQRDFLKRSVVLWVRRGDGPQAMIALVETQRTVHRVPVAVSCRALGLSESWFYKHHGRPPTRAQERRRELDRAIERVFTENDGEYGSPRVHAELIERERWRGLSVNTVAERCASSGWTRSTAPGGDR